ncbi:hypothetical protein DFP72DRAFT_1177558 [Ephemerocybe angulata]|uniref:Uncharacterized protein n=1 Tax=Ephemerocybe angulata TaxID=980116 RepID=A0A8H6HCC5_9AGAR|nr:hypothetical protein DFP72DRAFT_1177558 [Tulosesus angulatus]
MNSWDISSFTQIGFSEPDVQPQATWHTQQATNTPLAVPSPYPSTDVYDPFFDTPPTLFSSSYTSTHNTFPNHTQEQSNLYQYDNSHSGISSTIAVNSGLDYHRTSNGTSTPTSLFPARGEPYTHRNYNLPALDTPISPAPTSPVAPPRQTEIPAPNSKARPSKPAKGKENKPEPESSNEPTKRKPGRPKGAGTRSGAANRRAKGTSDDEVEKLTPDQKKAAALKLPAVKPEAEKADEGVRIGSLGDDQKVQIVKYVTQPEVWAKFRLAQSNVWTKLSQEVLTPAGAFTPEKIKNFYDEAFKKYKAAKALDNAYKKPEHTGGGDGDADRAFPSSGADGDAESGGEDVKKRKRGPKTELGYSVALLEAFKETKIYELFDAVAGNDDTVVRSNNISSRTALSDIDLSDAEDVKPGKKKQRVEPPSSSPARDPTQRDEQKALRDVAAAMAQRSRTAEQQARYNEELARAKFQLDVRKEKREAELADVQKQQAQADLLSSRTKLELESQKEKREAELADVQKKQAHANLITTFLNAGDEVAKEAGRLLLKKFMENENLDLDKLLS